VSSIVRAGGGSGGGGASNVLMVAKGTYDFAVQGGAPDAVIPLGAVIPNGCHVVFGYVRITQAFTTEEGDPSNLKIGLQTTTDLLTSRSVLSAPFTAIQHAALAPSIATATIIRTTAEREATFYVDNVNEVGLSDGAFELYLFYFDPATA
jgi:hypothetical protein